MAGTGAAEVSVVLLASKQVYRMPLRHEPQLQLVQHPLHSALLTDEGGFGRQGGLLLLHRAEIVFDAESQNL